MGDNEALAHAFLLPSIFIVLGTYERIANINCSNDRV